jgi:hypothetical protein
MKTVEYTLGDHLFEMRDNLTINYPGRLAPVATVAAMAAVANVARRFRLRTLARYMAAWAYDVADVPMKADAFYAHQRLMPWAWHKRRPALRWWIYAEKTRAKLYAQKAFAVLATIQR